MTSTSTSTSTSTFRIGMLLYPQLTQLDLTGPHEVFAKMPDTEIFLAWKTREPVVADSGLAIMPTTTLAEAPQADLLFVPGGSGQIPLMHDPEVLAFLRRQAAGARYVTAVCTGAFLLGAAGLLRGYKVTTHWAYHDLLDRVGAIPTRGRVVIDRDRITAGGVTAGIDFGLRIAAELRGQSLAEGIQLGLEYDPEPPWPSGTPERADPRVVAAVRERFAGWRKKREESLAALPRA